MIRFIAYVLLKNTPHWRSVCWYFEPPWRLIDVPGVWGISNNHECLRSFVKCSSQKIKLQDEDLASSVPYFWHIQPFNLVYFKPLYLNLSREASQRIKMACKIADFFFELNKTAFYIDFLYPFLIARILPNIGKPFLLIFKASHKMNLASSSSIKLHTVISESRIALNQNGTKFPRIQMLELFLLRSWGKKKAKNSSYTKTQVPQNNNLDN